MPTTTTSASSTANPVTNAAPFDLTSGGLLFGCIGILVVAKMVGGDRGQNQQGRAYWGGARELGQARKIAKQQIYAFNPHRQRTATPCALYIGTPDLIYDRHRRQFYEANQTPLESQIERLESADSPAEQAAAKKLIDRYRPIESQPWQRVCKRDRTLYFPNVNRGTAVFGGAGTGKSFSVLNPYLRSAMDQGIHCLVWDFKYPEQTREIAGYAALRGYKVQVFAPSFAETQTLNILDFVRDSGDALGAGQLAKVMVKNSSLDVNKGGGNEFFETAGATVVQSAMMLAKWLEEDPLALAIARRIWQGEAPPLADLMSAAAITNLPALSTRIAYASHRINPWNVQEFAQLVSAGGGRQNGQTNVTEAGVIANAQKTLNQVVKRDFIPAICGRSDIDLDLDGDRPTLTIVGLNQDYRDVLAPLLATAIDLIVSRNVAHARQRITPLFVSLDELPTIYLPKIANWLAEARSAGFCGAIGLQNISQLKQMYGEDFATTILANCATKYLLNPQEEKSAESYSKYLGEKELRYRTQTYTYQKGGGSRSISEQVTRVPLMEPHEFLKLDTGQAVVISPDYRNRRKKETYIPIRIDITLPARDIAAAQESKEVWQNMVARAKQSGGIAKTDLELAQEYDRRRQLIEALFPPPPPKKLKAPLHLLVQRLKSKGYQAGDNRDLDLSRLVYVPAEWKDPNAPEGETKILIPEGEEGLQSLCVIVQANGYQIHPPHH